jgi:hypothetical protein
MTGETAEATLHMQCGIVRTYRGPLLRRVLVTIFLLAIVLGLMAVIGLVVVNNEGPLPVSKIAGMAALGALALVALWLILFELAYKVTLTDDAIAWSLFGWEHVLARADIGGRREARGHRGRRLLTIVPIDPRTKPLKLQPHLATDVPFEAWIAALRDLNAEDLNASEARILGDPSHGATPQERLARLAAARTLVNRLNMATTIVAVWCVIAPWPYPAAIGAAAVLPLLTWVAVVTSGGMVRFARSTTEAHAAAAMVPVLSAAALALRVYRDVHLIDVSSAANIGSVVGLALLALTAMVDRSLTRHVLRLVIAAVVAVAYGISVVALADIHFDRSPGQNYQSRIIDSHVDRGKLTTYLVTLAPWGPRQSAAEVSVPEAMFNRLTMPGSFACISLYDGAFGIPWFSVDACASSGSHSEGPFLRFDQVAPGTDPFGPPRPLRCPPGQEPITGWPQALGCRTR